MPLARVRPRGGGTIGDPLAIPFGCVTKRAGSHGSTLVEQPQPGGDVAVGFRTRDRLARDPRMGSTPYVIAVVNQKGGVGKTTTAVNLAACLAASERPTLLIDVDPQANASSAYGITGAERQVYDALVDGVPLSRCAVETELETLHVVPSGRDLVGAEIELVTMDAREYRLAEAIRALEDAYDIVLIDCPPSLGLLTLNALTAADAVLIPLQCEYYALEGLANLVETVDLVRSQLNPRLEIQGIVLTMADARNNLARQVEAEVRRHFGEKVYRTRIPRNVRLSEAPSHGQPILLYDIHSKGAAAYVKLADELLAQLAIDGAPRKPPALARDEADSVGPSASTPAEAEPVAGARSSAEAESGSAAASASGAASSVHVSPPTPPSSPTGDEDEPTP
jgi:chromosome partitioning protein